MASSLTYSEIQSITRKEFIPEVVDNILDSDAVFQRAAGKTKKMSGERIMVPVKYDVNSATTAYSGMDTLSTNHVDTVSAAEFNIKQNQITVVLSNFDRAKNKGKNAVIDYVQQKTEEATTDLKKSLIEQFYSDGTGTDSKELTGIQAYIDDSSNVNVYGSINRTDDTFWKAGYTASIGSLQLSDMAAAYIDCTSATDQPTIIVTTETIFNALEALQTANQRYSSSMDGYHKLTKEGVAKGSDGQVADMGFKALMYKGVPVVASEYCPATKMFFINEEYLQMYCMDHPEFSTDKMGFAMSDYITPVDQDGVLFRIYYYANMVGSQPRRNHQLTGVTA